MQITSDMIVLWGKHFGSLSIDDVPGIMGAIEGLTTGAGELTDKVTDLFSSNPEVFQPVYDAYASFHPGMGPLTKPVQVTE